MSLDNLIHSRIIIFQDIQTKKILDETTCLSTHLLHLLLTFSDSPSSSVQGIVTEEGHFDGHISTPTEYFYIEPAKR